MRWLATEARSFFGRAVSFLNTSLRTSAVVHPKVSSWIINVHGLGKKKTRCVGRSEGWMEGERRRAFQNRQLPHSRLSHLVVYDLVGRLRIHKVVRRIR